MDVVSAGIIGLVFLVLSWQPVSRVVLLPEADGRVGSVLVTSESSEQLISTAFTGAEVSKRGVITLQAEDAGQINQRYAALLAARPAAPVSFILYFEFGSAVDIAPTFKPVLDQLMAALATYPAPEITVIGHTDRVGSEESNDVLSLQRAQTVRDFILQAGVRADIEVSGRGEREPIVPTADEVAESRNRRVEINVR